MSAGAAVPGVSKNGASSISSLCDRMKRARSSILNDCVAARNHDYTPV